MEFCPDINANSIPIEEQENAYRALKESFEAIKNNKSKHKFLEECMLSNENTFIWFCTFFRELEKIIAPQNERYLVPYDITYLTKNRTFLYFQYPMYVTQFKGNYVARYKKYKGNPLAQDIVNKHRAELISKRLEYADFRNGFPNWYVVSHVVFEKYSSKINKRVKLLYNAKGEFEYYICGASDNWEQIYNVPLEIDDVIACILFDD